MKKYLLPLTVLIIGLGYIAYTEKNARNTNLPKPVKDQLLTNTPST